MDYLFVEKKEGSSKCIERCQFLTNRMFITLGEECLCRVWIINDNLTIEKQCELRDHSTWVYGLHVCKRQSLFITYERNQTCCLYSFNSRNNEIKLLVKYKNPNLDPTDMIESSVIYNDLCITGSKYGVLTVYNFMTDQIVNESYFNEVAELYVFNNELFLTNNHMIEILNLSTFDIIQNHPFNYWITEIEQLHLWNFKMDTFYI